MFILVINPGSTSTKMAVYEDESPMVLRSITHTTEELSKFDDVLEQQDYRKQLVLAELKRMNIPMEFDAVIGRGGLVKPIAGGVYEINQRMLDDTHSGIALHNHACNLGCLIAYDIASQIPGCRAFIADPGVVDELNDYARISGSPLMGRICIWHALNQRAIARRFAQEIGRTGRRCQQRPRRRGTLLARACRQSASRRPHPPLLQRQVLGEAAAEAHRRQGRPERPPRHARREGDRTAHRRR